MATSTLPQYYLPVTWSCIYIYDTGHLCPSIPSYAHIARVDVVDRLPLSEVDIYCEEGYNFTQDTNLSTLVTCDAAYSWLPLSPVLLFTCESHEPREGTV